MTATNIEVVKNQNEANINLVRRFAKGVKGSGVLKYARKLRFHERAQSKLKKKERALKRIVRTKKMEQLKKLGKIK